MMKDKIKDCKYKDNDLPESWFERFKVLWRILDVDFGFSYDDDEVLMMLFLGFPPSINDLKVSFMSQLDSSLDTLTVEKFKSQFILYYHMNKIPSMPKCPKTWPCIHLIRVNKDKIRKTYTVKMQQRRSLLQVLISRNNLLHMWENQSLHSQSSWINH